MFSLPHNESVPLAQSGDGGLFVAATRVPLETVVDAWQQGNSPEEIVAQFDVLELSDVYLVIGFYLRHQQEVDRYIQERDQQAAQVRAQHQSRNQQSGLRERLLARRQAQQGVQ